MIIKLEDAVFKYNLTLSAIQILVWLRKFGPMSVKQLASSLEVSLRTVTRGIKSLIQKYLIEIVWVNAHNENVYQLAIDPED